MRRYRRKQLRYGLLSGLVLFAGGWAATTFVTPPEVFTEYPRWRTTLWVYLGAHLIELSNTYTGGFGFGSRQPLQILDLPFAIRYVPPIAVTVAAAYTCGEITTHSIQHNISNALAAGTGYFLAGIVAMVLSDIQPGISFILLIGVGVSLAVWLGSSFVGAFTRGLPIFGVASFGSIAAIGFLALLGGMAILNAIWGLVAISFGTAAVTGTVIGIERSMKRKGRRKNSDYPLFSGVKLFVEDNWKELIAVIAIVLALIMGLTRTG